MIYLFIFMVSLLFTYMVRVYALKKSLLDIPNERSSHTHATPHGGGIAIAVTWFTGLTYLFFNNQLDQDLYLSLILGVVLSIVSFFDDVVELSAKIRLLVQSIVAGLGIYFLGGLSLIDFGLFSIDNSLVTSVFAFFMTVWFINLYNFLDGIDGYAGSEMLFLALAGFILFGGDYFLLMTASVAGFLVLNWHKAKIFMGDVGSTLLGYNIAIFTIYYANEEPMNLWVWIVLFGLFWFDATLTLYRRFKNGESLSVAHKKHAYQRLTQSGWSHNKVVLFSIGVNAMLLALVYFISNSLLLLCISLFMLYMVMRFVDKRKAFK